MFERFADLMKSFISHYNNGGFREMSQYRSSSGSDAMETWKSTVLIICFAGVLALASPPRSKDENSAKPIHIIKPPVRCPEGMKPDANGRCREVWERSVDDLCPEGKLPDEDGVCRETGETSDCFGDECLLVKRVEKREVAEGEGNDLTAETIGPLKKHRRAEALKSEKKIKKRSDSDGGRAAKQARSKHAFLIMLKKKKMQMMRPKPPPPPPPPHHHPPHHHPPHHEESEEEPEEAEEEAPAEEDQPAPGRLFFGDEICDGTGNSTEECRPDVEMVEDVEANKEFKEWKPSESSESSDSSSSSSSSSSDSTGESESDWGSGESEDEVLEKAIKIKLMKLFRMKQRYGPALRRWLVNQLREYEDSFNYK